MLVICSSIYVNSCVTSNKSVQYDELKDKIIVDNNSHGLLLEFEKGKAFNHPTFVIWAEDLDGKYLKTIYITKSYSSGIYANQMHGDTLWLPQQGPSYQPAALPYWTHKKGLIDNVGLIPTPDHPFVDAYIGATPQNSFRFETQNIDQNYRLLVEVNQAWDWNKFWTNNKYPENEAYKHSAQPSLIYAVIIDSADSVLYLNPIGHGSPTGENGKLYTDLTTITSAKQIFSSIRALIK